MKIVTLALIACALLFAQEKKPVSQSKPPAAASLPGIPAGAKEIEPGLYRYTDPEGKTWLMRKTPFGVGKWEDKPDAQPAVVQSNVPVTITDLGDSIQFVRDSPFGPSKWTRKKSELTDEEKAIVKREQSKHSGASSADNKQQTEKREKQ
ncbi:MAG TPA: hypothetical protein VEU96_22170 [Bryobacteraceae bacterium]|nr:hypothetical protein [Bryobacteraceae bacterium]